MPERTCPTCGNRFDPEASPAQPFCCERCRLVDLGRWMREKHTLPVEREPEGEGPEPDEAI